MKINKYLRGKNPTHLHLQSTEEPSPGRCTPAGQCSGISAPWCRYQKVKNEATWIKNQVELAATRLAARLCTHWPKTSPHLNWTSVQEKPQHCAAERKHTLTNACPCVAPLTVSVYKQAQNLSNFVLWWKSRKKKHTHTQGRNKPRCCNSSWGSALCQHTGCMVKKKTCMLGLISSLCTTRLLPLKKRKILPPQLDDRADCNQGTSLHIC